MIGSFNIFEEINSPASFFDNRIGLFSANEFIFLQNLNNTNNNNNIFYDRPLYNNSQFKKNHNLSDSIVFESLELSNRDIQQQDMLIEKEGELGGKLESEQTILQQQQQQQQLQQSEQIDLVDFQNRKTIISLRRCRVSSIIRQSSGSSDNEEDSNQCLAFSEQKISLFQACFFLPGDIYLDFSYLADTLSIASDHFVSAGIGGASMIEEAQQQQGQKTCALNQWKECYRVSKGENNYFYSLRPTCLKENSIEQMQLYLKNLQQTFSRDSSKTIVSNYEDSSELQENLTFLQQLSIDIGDKQENRPQVDEVLEIPVTESINDHIQNSLDSHGQVDLEKLGGQIMKEQEESSGSTNSFLFSQVFTTHQSSPRQLQMLIFSGKFLDILHSCDKKKEQLSTSSLLKEGIFDFLSTHSRFLFSKLQATVTLREDQNLKENLTLITKDGFKLPSVVSVAVRKIQIEGDIIHFFVFDFKIKIKHQKCLAKMRKTKKHTDKEDHKEITSNQVFETLNSGRKRRKASDDAYSSLINDEIEPEHLEQTSSQINDQNYSSFRLRKTNKKEALEG